MKMINGFWTGFMPARKALVCLSIFVSVVMFLSPVATPAGAQGYNGCVGEYAGEWGIICPTSTDELQYIEYVKSTSYGVSIRMTEEGVMRGITCEGAAELTRISSFLYSHLPVDQRAESDLLWAEPYLTSEVMAHSVLTATQIPELVSHGNPIDIVFSDYSTPGSQGLFWRSLDSPNAIFNPGTCAGNN
jgi:hypothetical protein